VSTPPSSSNLAPAASSAANGPDTLVLYLSEDAYAGDAEFSVAVDGKALAAPQSATASHSKGQSQAFTFNGNFGPGSHTVGVAFVNDRWDGTDATDRNLYIDSATFDGNQGAGATPLYQNGTVTFAAASGPTPALSQGTAPPSQASSATASTPSPVAAATSPATATTAQAATTPSSSSSGGSENFAAAGRGGALLPSGYLSTSGSQTIDASGNPVRIASIGWYGTDGPAGSALQGLWTTSYSDILNSIKQDGFNTVRIPWSDADLNTPFAGTNELGGVDWSKNPDLKGLTTLQVFHKIADAASQIGLKLIFDHHTDDGSGGQQPNGLWIDKGPGTDGTDGAGVQGTVDAAKFKADWVQLADSFKGNSTVIGFDLDNEPTTGHGANWGGGGPLDIRQMYSDVGNAIQAVNPGALIIAEGLITPDGSGYPQTLATAGINPVTLGISNKLVYSVHNYPSSIGGNHVDSGPDAVKAMNDQWGYLVSGNKAPVWVGEMGANLKTAGDQAWAKTLLDYMNGKDGAQGGPTFSGNAQPVGGSYWNIGSEGGSGQPDGN